MNNYVCYGHCLYSIARQEVKKFLVSTEGDSIKAEFKISVTAHFCVLLGSRQVPYDMHEYQSTYRNRCNEAHLTDGVSTGNTDVKSHLWHSWKRTVRQKNKQTWHQMQPQASTMYQMMDWFLFISS